MEPYYYSSLKLTLSKKDDDSVTFLNLIVEFRKKELFDLFESTGPANIVDDTLIQLSAEERYSVIDVETFLITEAEVEKLKGEEKVIALKTLTEQETVEMYTDKYMYYPDASEEDITGEYED